MTEVDLSVACYERTYRDVLRPSFFDQLAADHEFRFARRTVVVNNVASRSDVESRLQELAAAGELDAWFFVEDHLAAALARTGVSQAAIARAPYFTDWGLVTVTVPGPDWVVHCDAEVRMQAPADWITPAIELMEADRRVMVANPRWYTPPGREDTLDGSTLEQAGDFALGLGFSDQLFLARRSELGAPIYSERCLATRRYPMAHVTLSFEARVDAWMRHHDRLRASHREAVYVHPDEIGAGYPDRRPAEKARALFNAATIAAARRAPLKRRCWRGI